jgi:uncharacterized RDD family membrane protein YckC
VSIAARRPRTRAAPRSASPVAVEQAATAAAPVARQYVGLVTRTVAFAVDAAVINVAAIVTAAVVTLALSVITVPNGLDAVVAAVGGALYVVWAVTYFVTFWATTGQTPGSRLLRIRVCPASGGRLPPRRALVRFAGLTLAALPLFAGFLLILVDDQRRGLQDRLARTVVVEADDGLPAAPVHPDRMTRPGGR